MTETPAEDAPKTGITGGRATGIVVASGISAVAGLLITVIAERSMEPEQNTEFLVFWAVMFGIFGIISGTQTESTRAVNAGRMLDAKAEPNGAEPTGPRAGVIATALKIGAVVGALVLVSGMWWAPHFMTSTAVLATILIGLGVFLYAGEMSLSGSLAGAKEWNAYSGLMAGEAALRLALVLVVGLTTANLAHFELAAAIPAATWLLFLLFPVGRRAFGAKADVGTKKLVQFNISTMISSAGWAALVTGFPSLLQLTSPGADAAVMSMTILAITLTRAPIMIPLQAFQGVLITWIAGASEGRFKILAKIMAGLLGLGIVGAALAAWIGPPLLDLIYKSTHFPGWLLAGLMIAAVSIAWLVLTGASTIALDEHRAYTTGWVAAAVFALVLLWVLPFSVPIRAIITLAVAPLLGVGIHIAAMRKAG